MGDLIRACPNVVLGRFAAITSFDSGAYFLGEAEKAAGWESRGGIAYSPKISDMSHLPYDQFDEWYVFENAVELGELIPASTNLFSLGPRDREVCVFVNYQGFSLDAPETEALTKIFWAQMDWIRPLAYIVDGTCLNFATSDKKLFAAVRDGLIGP